MQRHWVSSGAGPPGGAGASSVVPKPCRHGPKGNALAEAGISEDEAIAIYKLTTQATMDDRFVFPPYHREMSIEAGKDPLTHKGETGLGNIQTPKRSS